MAALSVSHSFHNKVSSIQELKSRSCSRIIVLSCGNHDPAGTSASETLEERKGKKKLFLQVLASVGKIGSGLKENMSPKQKGDWKDLMLMSLSFAVYVYMSQKIVCAYLAWMSMLKQSW
ncbi:hypothetical protein SLE2022_176700 [Rubroshorea leprosula]